jgi:uncharacterized Zn-binding protein involved in type VI secretion
MKKYIYLITVFSFLTCSFSFYDSHSPENIISLRLIHIAGESPKVFTEGWVFGAEGILFPDSNNSSDISKKIRWSGTGKFYPEYGPETHPVFEHSGINTIKIECEYNGIKLQKSFQVYAVMPDYYACVGDHALCLADVHGCFGCPHTVTGPITTGSPTVKVRNKAAARVGDGGVHSACCGPNTFTIIEGDDEVLIDGKPAAKIGSKTQHCGGSGYITGVNSFDDYSHESIGKYDLRNPYGIKVEKDEANPNVFYPGERVPASVLMKMAKPPKEFNADLIIKPEGADMSAAYNELATNFNDIMNLQGGFLTLIEEIGQFDCVKGINEALGKLGLMFSVVQVIGNINDGKNTEALGNTFKTAAYWAIGNYGWSALKVASVGVLIFDYVISKFISEMLDVRYQGYKKAYYAYYNDDSQVKRDIKKWNKVIEGIYNDSRNLNQDYQSRLEDEIATYQSKFWNPEVMAFYLKEGGFNAELSQEEKKSIMDDYRKNVINPIVNAANLGMMAREKRKIDADIGKQINDLSKDLNTKFPFLVKVTGPEANIKKIKVKIGEWTGFTDEKGLWKFDATLYAYIKNGSPKEAEFTTAEGSVKKVDFKLKEKGVTEILLEIPPPMTLKLDYILNKTENGTECVVSAIPGNLGPNFKGYFNESDIYRYVYYDWEVNGVPLALNQYPSEGTAANNQTTLFDKPGDYTIEARLVNDYYTHPDYKKTIASAKQTIIIKDEKKKDKEKKKENEGVITKNEENSGELSEFYGDYWLSFNHIDQMHAIECETSSYITRIPAIRETLTDNDLIPVKINRNTFSVNYSRNSSALQQSEKITGTGKIYKDGNTVKMDFSASFNLSGGYSITANLKYSGSLDVNKDFELNIISGSVTFSGPNYSEGGTVKKNARVFFAKDKRY